MLFFNSKVLLYVRKNKLEIFLSGKHDEVEIPPKVFQNIEILDTASFEKLIGDFLASLNLGSKIAVLALSDEITFHKSIPAVETDEVPAMIQAFLDSVPFDPENLAVKKLQTGDRILILATNKEVYETILRIAGELDWKILAVIPAAVFKEKLGLSDDVLDTAIAGKILSEKKLITLSDLLNDNEDIKEPSSGSSSRIVILVLILLLVGAIVALLLYFRVSRALPFFGKAEEKKAVETVEDKTATSSAKEVSTASATLQGNALERSKIKIQVLNGSGADGQAAKVRDQLVELGYDEGNIELGNATGSGETVVIFSKKVPKELRDELVAELKNTFADVTTQEETEESDFDIIVTTGRTSSP